MTDTFICEECKKEFIKEWSDDEAEIEFKTEFPDFPMENCAIVCEDCYHRLMFINQSFNRMS